MEYRLIKQVRDHEILRRSFMELADKVFGISFQRWYEQGYWTDRYIPYVIAKGERVIACAAANRMKLLWHGRESAQIQIGTVMTDPDYRNRGLSAALIKEILSDFQDCCHGFYLFANSTVLDFYPKFGFARKVEYEHIVPVVKAKCFFEKLDMEEERGRETLRRCYALSNPYGALNMVDNRGLLMFYAGGFLKDCVHYCPQIDTVCIAQQEGDMLLCHDIFGKGGLPLEEILGALAPPGVEKAVLGFTPLNADGFLCRAVEGDDALFVLEKKDPFAGEKFRYPSLSHA